MDRVRFIPGKAAREEIEDADGHIFFGRQTALDYADEFVLKRPGGFGHPLNILMQTMWTCLSEGDQVDIWFGLRDPDPNRGETLEPTGEKIGHTWATLKTADGREKCLWEVGRDTPEIGERQAWHAFNGYRLAVALWLEEGFPKATLPYPTGPEAEAYPKEHNGKPVMSRSLSPSNIYNSSGVMWYFVNLAPPDDPEIPSLPSRPMRAFEALVLASILTLAYGSPPIVFAVQQTLEGLGKLPKGYVRAVCQESPRGEPDEYHPVVVI